MKLNIDCQIDFDQKTIHVYKDKELIFHVTFPAGEARIEILPSKFPGSFELNYLDMTVFVDNINQMLDNYELISSESTNQELLMNVNHSIDIKTYKEFLKEPSSK